MKLKKKAKVLLLVILALFLIGIGVSWMVMTGPVNSNDKNDIEVVIKNGSSSSSIGKLLKENGLIKSELMFKIYLRLNNINSLKASTYKFNKSMDLVSIIKV